MHPPPPGHGDNLGEYKPIERKGGPRDDDARPQIKLLCLSPLLQLKKQTVQGSTENITLNVNVSTIKFRFQRTKFSYISV